MKQNQTFGKNLIAGSGERGALTIFTAVLVLILMTLMLVYATRVSLFETRVSGNEVRQKEAFHVAEAALDQGIMFLLSNASLVLSSRVDAFPDGTDFTRDGWLAAGNLKWQPCSSVTSSTPHPCDDAAATTGSYFYDTDDNPNTVESMPVNTADFPVDAVGNLTTTARLSALMCFVNLETPTATACEFDPTTPTEEAETSLVLTLLAYGYSDCTDPDDVATCNGEATVALPVSNYKKLSGSPGVPLVSKSTIPFSGSMEIVGNPNGGGIGVPLTTWVDGTTGVVPGCGDFISPILSDGTWQTCEMEEWYHANHQPEDVICDDNNCRCIPDGAPAGDTSNFLSWRKSDSDCNIGIDIIEDPSFPPDLFELFFGVPRSLYLPIKSTAKIINAKDCSSLGPLSSGLIWVIDDGSKCQLDGKRLNTDPSLPPIYGELTIGWPTAPIVIVSTAEETVLNGGVNIFGVLYIFDGDPEGSTAELTTGGNATVYGAVIVDGTIGNLTGTFQIVYNDAVVASAAGIAGIGSVNGGWRDFGLPAITWPDLSP